MKVHIGHSKTLIHSLREHCDTARLRILHGIYATQLSQRTVLSCDQTRRESRDRALPQGPPTGRPSASRHRQCSSLPLRRPPPTAQARGKLRRQCGRTARPQAVRPRSGGGGMRHELHAHDGVLGAAHADEARAPHDLLVRVRVRVRVGVRVRVEG